MTDGPDPNEALLYGVVELLKAAGEARAVSVVLNSTVAVRREHYDNWNGGLYNVEIDLTVDYQTYGQLSGDERAAVESAIAAVAEPILACGENDTFRGVHVRPGGRPRPNWRAEGHDFVRGVGVSNQGRVRSDNIATREEDGLLFRSLPEVPLYRALKRRGVTFAPLPVFLRGGAEYRRLEPDFIVLKDGMVFQIEVDGDTYHRETPADAQRRLTPMEYEGVKVLRFNAEELANDEMAVSVVDKAIKWMAKAKTNRP